MTRKILCLGGSTTIGVRSTRGWPEHLQQTLVGKALVHNAGEAGARLVDILRGLPQVLHYHRGPKAIIIQVPLHDARGGGLPPSEVGILLQQIVDWCGEVDPQIICLATPTPIITIGGAVEGFNRPSRRWHPKAVQVVTELAEELSLPLIPFHLLSVDGMIDQVHPGRRGYEWMGQTAAATVLEAWGRLGI